MSKGNPRVTIRLSPRLLEEVAAAVDKRNAACITIRHWDMSAFIVKAIQEKLAHDKRSRKKKSRPGAVQDDGSWNCESALDTTPHQEVDSPRCPESLPARGTFPEPSPDSAR